MRLVAAALFLMPCLAEAAAPTKATVVTVGLKPDGKKAGRLRERVRLALGARANLTLIPEAEEKRLFASPPPKPTQKRLDAAQKTLRRASKNFRNFELDKAQAGFAKATELLEPLIGSRAAVALDRERLEMGGSLAHALRNDSQLQELLLEHAIRYGAEGPSSWPPELTEQLKAATPPANTEMDVLSTPPGAAVYVDGVQVGVTPATLTVRPGPHRVELQLDGFHPADAWVATTALKKQKVDVNLAPNVSNALRKQSIAGPLDPDLVKRVIDLAEGAGASVVVAAGIKKGRIQLRTITKSGETPQRFEADDSPAGAKLAVAQMFASDDETAGLSGVPVWAWVGVGVGAAALGTGIGLRYAAIDAQDDLIAREGSLTQKQAFDRNSTVNTRATSGTIMLGVGAAALTTIAAYVVYDLLVSD